MKKRKEVYDLYWYFAYERQNIFIKKLNGEPYPWTNDEILNTYWPKGYNNFKISGRNCADHCAKSITPYFFKPEYQLEGFCELLDIGLS